MYHVYNRTVGKTKCFDSHSNYLFFLERFNEFIVPIADVFAFNLIPKEYHFIIKIREEKRLIEISNNKNIEPQKLISKQFRRCFLSYTNLYNLEHKRQGALFLKPFRRNLIIDEIDLAEKIKHIHLLPVRKKLCSFPENWKYSSYPMIINHRASIVSKDISQYFSSMNAFIDFHQRKSEWYAA